MGDNGREEIVKEQLQEQRRRTVHDRNLAGLDGADTRERARLLEQVTKSDLDAPSDVLGQLSAQDFPLANYDELADSYELKAMQEILALLEEVRHPHPESALQGAVRQWAFDDPEKDATAKDPEDYIDQEAFLLGTYSRATRAEDGFQQEVSAKQTRESITRDESKEQKGRIRSFFSRD